MATASKRHSKYHPDRPCNTCLLCGKSSSYFTHYGAWTAEEKEFLQGHWDGEPDDGSCICIAHQKEAKRVHPPEYTPKWSRKEKVTGTLKEDIVCMYPSCTANNSKLITPSFAPVSELKAALKVHTESDSEEQKLCPKHYHELYRQFTSQPCASCGINPKPGAPFARHSPNASLINSILYEDVSDTLTPKDYICSTCYKAQLVIINSHQQTNHLRDMTENWEQQLSGTTDKLTRAILCSVLYVARNFESDRAVLLPHVCRVFLREYELSSGGDSHTLESGEGTVKFTSRWLLKQLTLHLHSHMNSKCVHKKFGVLLFRKGGDLLTSLSWALGTGKLEASEEIRYEHSTRHTKPTNISMILGEASSIINDLIRSEITKSSKSDLINMDGLNIDEQISTIDPLLWSFIEAITHTVRKNELTEDNACVKKLRRYYLICLLIFCTNSQQPTALHTLLSDAVEVCGGSRKLMKILNRFGAVSSPDTHDRFVAHVGNIQRLRTLWDDLSDETLTVASADNWDMLQSHASVYHGDQSRGYHAVTLQISQPNPEICLRVTPDNTETLKRSIGDSPSNSPHKLGKVGPKRPRTLIPRKLVEQIQTANRLQGVTGDQGVRPVPGAPTHTLCIEGFSESKSEKLERKSLESKVLAYSFLKHTLGGASNRMVCEFKDIFAYSTQGSVNKSNLHYMELVDENPDSAETMRHVSELLLSTANSEHQEGYVLLIGDGKTYQHLMEIKQTYGMLLDKLLIFPGDWHILANFQPVLIKIYYHAGLKELAQVAGFKGETLTSLEKCSNFKRTHQFLLQVWQAIFRAFICAFSTAYPDIPDVTLDENIDMLKDMESFLSDSGLAKDFKAYLSSVADADDTWKFWQRFVFEDCFSYIQMHLAIRCQNWELRISALKLMAPLFNAYDRTTYQRLIPYHLADLQKFPPKILEHLKKGFTISITGGKGHALAIDESHEMCINKDLKMAVARPTKPYLQKVSLFLRYRISAHKNLLTQIFPTAKSRVIILFQLFVDTPEIKKREGNITVMLEEIRSKALLPASVTANRGLVNVFTNTKATPEQRHDLLNFREIGSTDLTNYINHHLLKIPSTTSAPVRKNKLLTMAPPKKVSKRRMNQKEKELKQVTKCLRQRLAWCNRTGQSYDPTKEQYSLYPRAIADENGIPLKGSKSIWKDKLRKRYPGPITQVVSNMLPDQWIPEAVVLDGMFLINCKPLRSTESIKDYSNFLFNRFLLPHYRAGVCEVHLLFDKPSTGTMFNPKVYEQTRRDKGKGSLSHHHQSFTPSTKTPTSWRSFIECRECKRSLIEAIGLSFMQSVRLNLRTGQKLYLGGCFPETGNNCTFRMSANELPAPAPEYMSNAVEADQRIWRHVAQTCVTRVLIYSPDTDIYNIGLSLLNKLPTKDVIVQLNVPHSQQLIYIRMHTLVEALALDPDLGNIARHALASTLQMLFISSGCDYLSYFAGQGKAAFFNAFFQHASFISGQHMCGSLCDIDEERKETGFLAFLRLVGTLYFKKHFAAIVSLKGVETPQQLLNAQDNCSPKEMHQSWYNSIRAIVSDRIIVEQDRMPSLTSMWRHWLRSCWVACMWFNSTEEDLHHSLPPPEACGWKKSDDGNYEFDWECPDIQRDVQDTINFLIKGCGCKKGCQTQRCGCFKHLHHCGPGCQCQNCLNLPSPSTVMSGPAVTAESTSSDEEEGDTSAGSSSDTSGSSSESEEERNIQTEIISDIYDDQNNFSIIDF